MNELFSAIGLESVGASRQRGLMFGALVAVSILAIASQVLVRPGAYVMAEGEDSSESSSRPNSDDFRSCTATGSIFMNATRPIEAINIFQARMSAVVAEREEILRKATAWECFDESGEIHPPPSPLLQQLALELPGWHYKYTADVGVGMQTIYVPKPVNYESFASVVMELEREYECKLTQFQVDSTYLVRTDHDLDDPSLGANPGGGSYCCTLPGDFCMDDTATDSNGNTVVCNDDKYHGPDGTCGQLCTVEGTYDEFGVRVKENQKRMIRERNRARIAVERTLSTLRSFETAVVFTVQMSCFQRAGLDIKNELSLLADGSSCMPKIWDSLNSLHDTKDNAPPEL
jgi:hypothetical protein